MIFMLHFDITIGQLYIHYDYFEWALCIETFGIFAKCDESNMQVVAKAYYAFYKVVSHIYLFQ